MIEQAIHKEVPDAKVVVKEDCYEIDRDSSKGDAIRIGRTLDLGNFQTYIIFMDRISVLSLCSFACIIRVRTEKTMEVITFE